MICSLFSLTLSVCNLADDTTPYVCDTDLPSLLQKRESDTIPAIMWFDANYMKLNQSKCHFVFPGNTPEYQWAKVGEKTIWESNQE